MAGSLLGTGGRPGEDPELLPGRGNFVDKLPVAGGLYVGFVRSPLPHALVQGVGRAGARDAAGAEVLEGADVVVRARFENQRVAVAPMEGNAIAVVPGEDPEITVYVSTQMPHAFKAAAAGLFGLEPDRLRVVTPHVGGGF